MAYPGPDDSGLVPDPGDDEPPFVAELGERVPADVAQPLVLEVLPEPFISCGVVDGAFTHSHLCRNPRAGP